MDRSDRRAIGARGAPLTALPAILLSLLLQTVPVSWSHDIDVTIDPNRSHLQAVDHVTIGAGVPGEAPAPFRFDLHSGLRVTSFALDGKERLSALVRKPGPAGGHLDSFEGPPAGPGMRVTLKYEGIIHDPVRSEGDLGFVAGDLTTGLIGPEGVFLDGGTGWVPLVRNAGGTMTHYAVTARIPSPWQVVTQGRVEQAAKTQKGFTISRHVSEVPSDGLALVAGRYRVKSIDHAGVRISTYFFEQDAGLADIYLKSTAEYLDRFSALLTPYPYTRFDIVENFFTTGYGFPSFTLLGQDVIRMGEMALRPGYVDHEVMHCWWGNFVYPDNGTGNWSEGLTTYLANYLAQEAIGPEAAAEYRRNIATKYALRVKPGIDYPLSRFVVKTHDYDNEIGYGKAAMVFHQLRRMSGDPAFFSVMRGMATGFGGKRAGWDDFRSEFEKATGRDLKGFFAQWIGRTGLPDLALDTATVSRSAAGFRVTGSILQDAGGPVYGLSIPIIVDTAAGPTQFEIDVTAARTSFALDLDSVPVEIRLDPDMHVPRHLRGPEIPPCLNAVIESDDRMIIVPEAVMARPDDPYMELARRIGESRGTAPISDTEASRIPGHAGRPLLLLGRPDENRMTAEFLARPDLPVGMVAGGFTVAGETFRGADYSLLVSTRSPDDPNQVVTLYFGLSPASLARSRYALFYGWDSYVVFKAGRVERRGFFETRDPRSLRLLLPDPTGGESATLAGTLMGHVKTLASPAMGGRRSSGGQGHDAAAAYVESAIRDAGLAPAGRVVPFADGYRHAFVNVLPEIEASPGPMAQLSLRNSAGTVSFDAVPFPVAPPPASGSRVEFTDQVIFVEPEELAWLAGTGEISNRIEGGIVITLERPPDASPDPALLADQVTGAARLGAAALVLVKTTAGPFAYESLISFPSRLSSTDQAAVDARRAKGGFAGVDIFLSGQRSRLPFAGTPPGILVVGVGPDVGMQLFGRARFTRMARPPMKAFEPGVRPILVSVEASVSARVRHDSRGMVNLLGYLEGSDPILAGEVVIVSAHYDAMGRTEEGVPLPGASDNAAGVAALIEVARLFGPSRNRPRRSILFAFFDGEEWGLAGSRALAGRLPEIGARVTSVMNVDSLGGGDPQSIFLIGGSRQPALRRVAAAAATVAGLKLGRDIDTYAFEYGSDYYPFHLAGIPAAGFFAADYRSLHTPGDTIEALNPAAVAAATRVAAMTLWALAN